jgi:copper chaperone CopZ
VENLGSVQSVKTDMNAHTVTVAFDDEEISVDDVVGALTKAGYAVPEYEKTD